MQARRGINMRKLISAAALCAVAVGLVAAPGALGVVQTKLVGGSVSVGETPNPLSDLTPNVASTGNVASNSNCRRFRTVRFSWVNATTNAVISTAPETTLTNVNGDYSASVTRPGTTSTSTSSVKLRASVDQEFRKIGSKKKGRKNKKGRRFNCLSIIADSSPITLEP
jgi:hypothetical protein